MSDFKYTTKKFCIIIIIIGFFYLVLSLLTSCTRVEGSITHDLKGIEVREIKYDGHSYLIFTEPYVSITRFSVVHNPDCLK